MATIAENLASIMQSVYGRDVRQAIHDSIRDCADAVDSFSTGVTNATNAANTAAGLADTAKNAANSAADRANTAAQAAETAVDHINNSSGIVSVNNKTGVVVLTASDVGAVATVNGKSGSSVTLDASDVGAVPAGTMASEEQSGLMSAEDKIKLDGSKTITFGRTNASKNIAAGATDTITASVTIPAGASVAITGFGLYYTSHNTCQPYGVASVSVSGTTATLSQQVKNTGSSQVNSYVHWEYAIIE